MIAFRCRWISLVFSAHLGIVYIVLIVSFYLNMHDFHRLNKLYRLLIQCFSVTNDTEREVLILA
jgi:hypothetical protein